MNGDILASVNQHSQLHSLEPAPHSQHSQPSQLLMEEEKNQEVDHNFSTINCSDEVDNEKRIEKNSQTGYVGYVQEPENETEQETEASLTGPFVTHEVAMSNDLSGYVEEYLESPEEDEMEVLEIGDRVLELLSGIKGVVVGFKDGRVVFDCREFGRCSRRAILRRENLERVSFVVCDVRLILFNSSVIESVVENLDFQRNNLIISSWFRIRRKLIT